MNREIKFRAWDETIEEMLPVIELQWRDGEISGYRVGDTTGSIGTYNAALPDIHLMQYTGLKDKNGKEIYEGDILSGSQLRVVEWFAHGWRVKVRTPKGDRWYDPFRKCDEIGDQLTSEVIGNIYENPDLLDPTP